MPNIIPISEITYMNYQVEDSDPNFVFIYQDLMYRLIINSDKEYGRWEKIQEFCKSKVFNALQIRGLIPVFAPTHFKLEGYEQGDIYRIIDIAFIPGPTQMTPSQRLDCLRIVCKIQIALEDYESSFSLTDVHYAQFGFLWSKPIYIDTGSFSERSNMLDEHLKPMLDEFGLAFGGDWEKLLHDIYHVKVEIPKGEWSNYDNGDTYAK